jgi:DNA polymerase lambda
MSKIYGVGLVRANQLYEAGARGIDQLRNEPERFPLSTASRIGLAIYEDLLERIPRDEVAAIGEVVKAAVREIAPGDDAISIEVMGSFRRGAADCGDVDFLITRDTADGKTHAGLLDKLLLFLRSSGFLTHDVRPRCLADRLAPADPILSPCRSSRFRWRDPRSR